MKFWFIIKYSNFPGKYDEIHKYIFHLKHWKMELHEIADTSV